MILKINNLTYIFYYGVKKKGGREPRFLYGIKKEIIHSRLKPDSFNIPKATCLHKN